MAPAESAEPASSDIKASTASSKPSLPLRRPSKEPLPSPTGLRSYSFRRRASGEGLQDASRNEAEDKLLQSLDEAQDIAAWLNHVVKQRLSGAGSGINGDKLHEEPGSEEGAANGDVAAAVSATGPASPANSLLRLERQLSSLGSSLGIARSETSARIDATIAEVRSSIPRLSFDLRFARDQAVACNRRLEEVRQQPVLRELQDEGQETVAAGPAGEPSASSPGATKSVTASPAAALSRLSALSTLRSRMTAARDVLRLAESWSTLSSDVSSYVAESKWTLAASRLSEARSSLSVFERTPEYEGRRDLLISLSDDVENAIVPLLAESLVKRDLANCKKLADAFRSIGREERFGEHWRKSRTSAVGLAWAEGVKPQQPSPQADFTSAFTRLLSQLQTLLNEEVLYAASLFPDKPYDALARLIEVSLTELTPSLPDALSQASERQGQEALSLIVRAHTAAKEAALSLHKVVDVEKENQKLAQLSLASTGAAEPGTTDVVAPPPPKSPEVTRERRLSVSLKRQSRPSSLLPPGTSSSLDPTDAITPARSASGNASFTTSPGVTPGGAFDDLSTYLSQPEAWEVALFSPFVPFQGGYEALETQLLAALWASESKSLGRKRATTTTTTTTTAAGSTMTAPTPSSIAPTHPASSLLSGSMARRLREEVDLACSLSEDAIGRALSLTWGLGAPGVINAIEELITRLLSEATEALDIDARQAAEEARNAAAEKMAAGQGNDFFGSSTGTGGADRDSSSSAKEWKAFEAGVGLLRSAKESWLRVERLEDGIALRLAPCATLVTRTRSRGVSLEDALGKVVGPREARSALAVAMDGGLADEPRLRSTMEMIELWSGGGRLGGTAHTWRSTSAIGHSTGQVDHLGAIPRGLLPRTKASLLHHSRTLQRHLCDIILAPLLPYFELYAALPAWEAARLPGAVNEYELAMPTFSLSPTETMSRVGEGMLDLPRLLEGWAEDEALVWAVGTLPYVEEEGEKGGEEASMGGGGGVETLEGGAATPLTRSASNSSKRMSFHPESSSGSMVMPTSPTTDRRSTHRHSHSVASIATTQPLSQKEKSDSTSVGIPTVSPPQPPPSAPPQADQVLQAYLRSISLVLLSHLTSLVLPSIPRLTSAGSSQLLADLDYLTNILSALNVDADEAGLAEWKRALGIEEQKGRQLNREARMNQGRHLKEEEREIIWTQSFQMVSRMRGWKAG